MFYFTGNTVISSMKIDQVMLCWEINGTYCDKDTKKINNLCMRNSGLWSGECHEVTTNFKRLSGKEVYV
jgi:hypothetical protein